MPSKVSEVQPVIPAASAPVVMGASAPSASLVVRSGGGESPATPRAADTGAAQDFFGVFVVFVVAVGGVGLAIYSPRAEINDDEDDEQQQEQKIKFSNRMTKHFFDAACLVAMASDDDADDRDRDDGEENSPLRIVDEYMGLWVGSLSTISLIYSNAQLLVVYVTKKMRP